MGLSGPELVGVLQLQGRLEGALELGVHGGGLVAGLEGRGHGAGGCEGANPSGLVRGGALPLHGEVAIHHLAGRTHGLHLALVEPEGLVAEAAHGVQVVTHQDDGAALAEELLDLADAAPLKVLVADGEDLVDEEHIAVRVGGDGEAQAQVHAR